MAAATIRDVARKAGVSVASASRALNAHKNVTAEMRDRVLEAARLLDYVPHLGARSLSTQRFNTIGVVLPDLFGEFFSEVIRGIDRAAHRRGLQLLLSNMHGNTLETAAAIRAMRGRVDGLIIMSPQVDSDFLTRNLPSGLPAVVLNGPTAGRGHASLSIDNHAGAHAAVAHLVDRGCRRIAHIAGPRGNNDAEERLRGFREAVAALLGDEAPFVLSGDFNEESGCLAGTTLAGCGQAIDGVFAANDMMAMGCVFALKEEGIAVPGDVAVIGFDDIPIARYMSPSLTTMQVRIADMASHALDQLVEGIENPEAISDRAEVVQPVLVVRQSTDRPLRTQAQAEGRAFEQKRSG